MTAPQQPQQIGVAIVGHGTGRGDANRVLIELAGEIRRRLKHALIEPGFVSRGEPSVAGAIQSLYAKGCRNVVVLPLLLLAGKHVQEDLPRIARECESELDGLRVEIMHALGQEPRLAGVVEDMLAPWIKDA